jgi:hypothetical protein
MPKQKKKSKQEEDDDLHDILAKFQAASIVAANNAGSSTPATSTLSAAITSLTTSSSSSGTGADARRLMTSLPNPAAAIREVQIFLRTQLSVQLQRWGRQGVRLRTANPLLWAVSNGASIEIISSW